MYCRVLACDFDGTGATDGHLAPEVAAALRAARARGIVTLLVTGRVLEDLRVALVDFSAFDAVVAENGAIVWFPERDETIQIGTSPPETLLGSLRAAGVPFKAGAVVIGTWEGHADDARRVVREAGLDLQLVFNRAALMLLPGGVDKAVGVRRALLELGRSERNMVAFGDAENDLALFEVAEYAVAPRGSVPQVAARADEQLARPGAAGVAHFITSLLAAGGRLPSTGRRRIELGRDPSGAPVWWPPGEGNVLVSGDPRSGKSFLTGLLAEHLIARGYRLCVLDPEGDHRELADEPGCVLLGERLALPAPEDVPAVLQDLDASTVLCLSALPHEARTRYVHVALDALAREREHSGIPHWTVVDEAQYFFHDGATGCADLRGGSGNVILATYRPSLLSAAVLDGISVHLLTHTEVDVERYFVATLLGARGPRDRSPADLLAELGPGLAGLLRSDGEGPTWQTFSPAARRTAHVHHGRKYVEGSVPAEKAFRFVPPGRGVVATAQNVREFAVALERVPLECLRSHLLAGDFSRWAREVLADRELAAGLAKLEQTTRLGAQANRRELIEHVRNRYVV